MSRGYTLLFDPLADYVRSVTLREPEALRRQREATDSHPRASLQISPEQGQFLHFMTRLVGARKAIEVGVFLGYSSSWIALAMQPEGKLVACDFSDEYTSFARKTWKEAGVDGKIDLRLAPALDTLDSLIASGEAGTFDFIFIDADKTNYCNYYERALKLLRTGGLVAADNTLRSGKVADPANTEIDTIAMREFNSKLYADERITLTLATIGDGITLACKL